MLGFRTKKIRKELALKYGLTLEQVDEIIRSPFLFQVFVMKSEFDAKNNKMPSTRISNFGLFYVPDYIKKRFEK